LCRSLGPVVSIRSQGISISPVQLGSNIVPYVPSVLVTPGVLAVPCLVMSCYFYRQIYINYPCHTLASSVQALEYYPRPTALLLYIMNLGRLQLLTYYLLEPNLLYIDLISLQYNFIFN